MLRDSYALSKLCLFPRNCRPQCPSCSVPDSMTRHHGGNAVPFLYEMNESNGLISSDIWKEKGDDLRERYQNADPFPHIVIDEFLPPDLLDTCLAEFPVGSDAAERTYDRKQ